MADTISKKRKEPPSSSGNSSRSGRMARHVDPKRQKMIDARNIRTQPSAAALEHGEVRVDKFVKAREFEIKALERNMLNSKKALSKRAFQEVPREMRRRTASHNKMRVPKRMRKRAEREMKEDNTPTVNAKTRKKTPRQWLRLDNAKRLKELSKKAKARAKKKKRAKEAEEKAKHDSVTTNKPAHEEPQGLVEVPVIIGGKPVLGRTTIITRKPRVKKSTLKHPPNPPATFRKRQIHKTWLPTHLFHAKRAHMTPPKEPLWRFAIPLTPTTKCYRPTHRASSMRGAVAWDTSYVSTIGLEGEERSVIALLKMIGVGVDAGEEEEKCWLRRGQKWRDGTRTWTGWVHERDKWPTNAVAPVTIMWCARQDDGKAVQEIDKTKRSRRKLFVRVHPAGFLRVWQELLRLSKVVKPHVTVEDLRFEIGSIELMGPNSTEALVAALRPIAVEKGSHAHESPEALWPLLKDVTNPSVLPNNTLLAFKVSDPRLHHPPKRIQPAQDHASQTKSLNVIATWPIDRTLSSPSLFERTARLAASRSLPSQKSINRRKSLAPPRGDAEPRPTDPNIPIILYPTRHSSNASVQATWTILLPWRCVLPVWYSLMHYPLNSGGTIRLGALQQKRQVYFEAGMPWFPAEFPGCNAGWEWEVQERIKRKAEWSRYPKGRRVEYDTLDLGLGRKGEVGRGWACDWERLLSGPPPPKAEEPAREDIDGSKEDKNQKAEANEKKKEKPVEESIKMPLIHHLDSSLASDILADSTASPTSPVIHNALISVRVTLLSRGVPQTCARVYRLPTSSPALREQWLSLIPPFSGPNKSKSRALDRRQPAPVKALPPFTENDIEQPERNAKLASEILAGPEGKRDYPVCPDEADLVGFVTTGNFNLGEGRGTGLGCLLLERVLGSDEGSKEGRLCVVREAGQTVGRLARWDVA